MASLLNMSGGSLLNKQLPYDYEVEYLESTGTQYIDTGVLANVTSSRSIKSEIDCKSSNEGDLSTLAARLGSNRLYLLHLYSGWCIGYGNYYNSKTLYDKYRHIITTEFEVGKQVLEVDGTAVIQKNENYDVITNLNFYLFACNYDGNVRYATFSTIYSCKIFANNVIVRYFIPVVKNGVGYMYDKVSGQLFGNAGTGNFILGPDVDEVGVSYIDLGLPSGTLWAKGNIVKDAQGNYAIGNETDYGCYFSWGNIDGHTTGDGYSFDSTNYNASPGASLTGNISDTDAVHNAACAILGDGATMPSTADLQELFNANNTTRQWTQVNGVNGYLLTSVRNGKTLFFPASGLRDGSFLYDRGQSGNYWSSSFYNATTALYLRFTSGYVNPALNNGHRFGFTVRAIKSNN